MASYQEQLESEEWKSRRDSIIKRDFNKCTFCGKGSSEMVLFGETTLYVGIDYSKSHVDCSKAILSTAIKVSELKEIFGKHKFKRGAISNSDNIGFLSNTGNYFYSPWKKHNNYKDAQLKGAYVAKVQCDDGTSVDILYSEEKELQDLKLPRIYVQHNPLTLQVHHKRYILGKQAWEYEDDDLVTLCQECHSKVHKYIPVQAYADVNGHLKVMNYTPCKRCNGMGYLPEYDYVQNGICFRCHGARFEELITQDVNLLE